MKPSNTIKYSPLGTMGTVNKMHTQ